MAAVIGIVCFLFVFFAGCAKTLLWTVHCEHIPNSLGQSAIAASVMVGFCIVLVGLPMSLLLIIAETRTRRLKR